jgi:S1-C subfamily serine protease
VFQHDSSLHPGSVQGMPLFDSRSRFLGITVETRTRGTSNAVSALRINDALPALLAGRTTEAARPGFIGITGGTLTTADAEKKGIPGGVPVTQLVKIKDEYRGAAKAGIKVKDIIIKVDGHQVLDIQTLQEVVQLFNPGEKVVFTVLRGKKTLDFTVTIEQLPHETQGRR